MKKIKEHAQIAYSTKQHNLQDVRIENNDKVAKPILNRILNGDCLDALSTFPDNFVDLTVFSPPYDEIKCAARYGNIQRAIPKEIVKITTPRYFSSPIISQ